MKAGVIGSGAWGTTLAKVLAENGHEVEIWSHDSEISRQINQNRENVSLLPGIKLPAQISCSLDLAQVCRGKHLLVLVVASQFFEATASRLAPLLNSEVYILSATKGFDEATKSRMSEILYSHFPEAFHSQIAILSGPNISREIALQKASTTVIASQSPATAQKIQSYFHNSYLRVYTNGDVIGTELGGALKNIIAIAAGVADGLELGDNAKSALMVRGLAEMSRFAAHFGAEKSTLFGLSGMGDLITTCSSKLSRNHFVGENLGQGKSLGSILSEMKNVAEGVGAAKIVHEIALEHGLDMPVTQQVYEVLFHQKNVQEAMADLMARESKPETDSGF